MPETCCRVRSPREPLYDFGLISSLRRRSLATTLLYPDGTDPVRGLNDGADKRRAEEESDARDERDGPLDPAPPRAGARGRGRASRPAPQGGAPEEGSPVPERALRPEPRGPRTPARGERRAGLRDGGSDGVTGNHERGRGLGAR